MNRRQGNDDGHADNKRTPPPSCVSNIDYHLEQLSNIYKESGKKVREGTEPSLMEQLLEANPSNASFLTPSSSSQVQSRLSDRQLRMTRNGSN